MFEIMFGIIIILAFFAFAGFIIGWDIYEELGMSVLYGVLGTTFGFGVILLFYVIDIMLLKL